MTLAHSLAALSNRTVLATLGVSRGRWFGSRQGFGLGGLLILLCAVLLIFLCIRALVSDRKTQ